MAKVTKSQLKGIVKECLIEILSEGIGGSRTSNMSSTATYGINESTAVKKRNQGRKRRSALDQVSYGRHQEHIEVEKRRKQDIEALTSDPLMASIFADTQATTVMDQAAASGKV